MLHKDAHIRAFFHTFRAEVAPKEKVAFLNHVLWLQTAPSTQGGEEECKKEHPALHASACRLKVQERHD